MATVLAFLSIASAFVCGVLGHKSQIERDEGTANVGVVYGAISILFALLVIIEINFPGA